MTAPELSPLNEILKVDQAILELFQQRCRLVSQVRNVEPIAKHCESTLHRVLESTRDVDRSVVERLIGYVAGLSFQSCATACKIAYLGPPYSYSYSAARKYFGTEFGLQAVQTIGAVFEEVERKQADYGIVPIENSTDGRIVDTLTMFVRKSVQICGEVFLPIHHNLLSLCDRGDIKEVYSKPQALSQCRSWLAEHLPGVRWVEVASTAIAAQIATTTPNSAAVASKDAGIAMGLNVVAENIEDSANNVTRFAIIGHEEPKPTERDKTSLMFQVPHKPGALADAMLIFRDRGLNLTWIESFPIPATLNEYFFFVELDGHRMQAPVQDAIEELNKMSIRLSLLGSYPKGLLTT